MSRRRHSTELSSISFFCINDSQLITDPHHSGDFSATMCTETGMTPFKSVQTTALSLEEGGMCNIKTGNCSTRMSHSDHSGQDLTTAGCSIITLPKGIQPSAAGVYPVQIGSREASPRISYSCLVISVI